MLIMMLPYNCRMCLAVILSCHTEASSLPPVHISTRIYGTVLRFAAGPDVRMWAWD